MSRKLILRLCLASCFIVQFRCHQILEQLDALDDSMTKELYSRQENTADNEECVEPELGFCKDEVKYSIAKAQATLHSYYDGLVESALDTLTLETKGSMLSCKRQLKRLMCRDRFPKCSNGKVDWANEAEKCGEVLEKCPQDVRDKLMQFEFCSKLNKGKRNIEECLHPLTSSDMKYCTVEKADKVAPWNRHSAIEVDGLLEMQTSLWNLSKECINGLSKYLCFPAKSCFAKNEVAKLFKKYTGLCREALRSCSNDVISSAMKDIFLNCN